MQRGHESDSRGGEGDRFVVISMGWGVQSFTLAAMSALGTLPPVDGAVFIDTGWESELTYQFIERWEGWLGERGVKVERVVVDFANPVETQWQRIAIPAHIRREDGAKGMLPRQCTRTWKVEPTRRWLQKRRRRKPVDLWMGITANEASRAKASRTKYIRHVYPFLTMFDPPMRRVDAIHWLEEHGLEVPPRSSCVFCPLKSRGDWLEMKRRGGQDWRTAVHVDWTIRYASDRFTAYLSRDMVPLEMLVSPEDQGQLTLWEEV